MEKPVVGLVKFSEKGSSLRDAVELADGFAGLDKDAPMLIKVNQAWGSSSKKFPLFGFATTARLVEDLVILLKEFGCSDIAIGEGTIPNAEFEPRVSGSMTRILASWRVTRNLNSIRGTSRCAEGYPTEVQSFRCMKFSTI